MMKQPAVTTQRSLNGETSLARRFRDVRRFSETLCEPLAPEDCVIQSMPEVSPTRWHLAHTTWFFETFALREYAPGYRPFDAAYETLFNSYYNTIGEPFPREQRGLLSRPTLAETLEYRRSVDDRLLGLLAREDDALPSGLTSVVEIGLHHEQQHQELMLTDIKHVFSRNPLWPAYQAAPPGDARKTRAPLEWFNFPAGLHRLGYAGPGFHFDNEAPAHRVFVEGFSLASRLSTNGEFLAFVEDGGYENPRFWLAEGWRLVREHGWQAPLYWAADSQGWREFTLAGLRPLRLAEPLCHVSYFEADAFALVGGAAGDRGGVGNRRLRRRPRGKLR